jgi:hypothetical protein
VLKMIPSTAKTSKMASCLLSNVYLSSSQA